MLRSIAAAGKQVQRSGVDAKPDLDLMRTTGDTADRGEIAVLFRGQARQRRVDLRGGLGVRAHRMNMCDWKGCSSGVQDARVGMLGSTLQRKVA